MRVSMGLFLDEKKKTREDWAIRLYELYKSRRFCSSTPTLFNSGTLHSQLSSCYLYYVDDSLEGIMYRGIAENAQLSKWAGGLGGSWTSVRGTGAHIAGTNGESQGVIPFLKLHNDQLVAVNQGGKRKGSGCAYLESWHNDIFEFLELRRNTGDDRRRTHDMNTANWIPDLFMKRMEARGTWTLFRANETPDLHHLYGKKFEEAYLRYEQLGEEGKIQAHKIEALELWKKMLSMLFETGHPWITFKDPCNVRSPQDHAGVIHSSNLCTEITLNTSNDETAVCNLGSVILDSHLKPDGSLDLEKLRDTVKVAVRALDNVIDINFYPTVPAKTSNLRHRPIGLGVMGLANALYLKGVPFASEAAVEFNDEFMEAIAHAAYEASSDPRGRARHLFQLQGLEVGPRPPPAGHRRPPRAGTRRADPGPPHLAPRLDRPPRQDRHPGHAQFQRARHRAHRDDLEHHEHLALHRAHLQEPLRQIQPLRRIRRPQPVPRPRPQEPRSLEPGDERRPEIFRRRAEGHRGHPRRPEGEIPHGLRRGLQMGHRRRRPPAEVDRPVPEREPLAEGRPT